MAKSAIGTAFGFISTITARIISGVRLQQTEDAILGLSEDTIKQLTDEFVQKLITSATGVAENYYRVIVDYGQTLQQMIANGKYDYVNGNINQNNFQISGNGKQDVVIELVHFGRDMESDAVLKEFEARGLRPATLPELLAFDITYPKKQCEFPIVALGSVWQGRVGSCDVPYLFGWYDRRKLSLGYWVDDGWRGACRFAAVRK